MRTTLFLTCIVIFITACTPIASPTSKPVPFPTDPAVTAAVPFIPNTREPLINPFSPKPTDGKFSRENVFIEESGLIVRESDPPQVSLTMSGNLPTPCHQLRAVVGAPDENNKINVDVYTVVDPNMMCTQVLKPFSESIDIGPFLEGHYSVWVNGMSVGEFDS